MSWNKSGYVVVRGALSARACQAFADKFRALRDTELSRTNDRLSHNDTQVADSFAMYGFLPAELLLGSSIKKIVEAKTKTPVHPTYSYTRIYYNGATLHPHRDRASCEISVTLCIEKDSTDWPIKLIDRRGNEVSVSQEPGDLVIYSGCELLHWRDAYTGQSQVQTFLHYVDAEGHNAGWKYDRRPALGTPELS